MLLRIENLQVHFRTPEGVAPAVDGVSLEVPRGKTVALVGESGCGKTVTALAILRLVPTPGRIVAGRILFDGKDLTALDARAMRSVRGGRIAMIFQEPMSSLNPVKPVGAQIVEAVRLHAGRPAPGRARSARARAVELLHKVGIPAPEARYHEYPHRLSGGMRQRVMIAMALAGDPDLLIADEPTTALDVTVQSQVLDLLNRIQNENGLSILLVTHDFGVVARMAAVVFVMYAGRIVERAPAERLFRDPRHPYTQRLLRCVPRLSGAERSSGRTRRLETIPGEVPRLATRPRGCAFHPRCDLGREDPTCRERQPELLDVTPGHTCACWQMEVGESRAK